MKDYEKHTAEGHNFFFKMDIIDTVTNEKELHIWIRYCVEPETVIEAFFNLDNKIYNERHKRWEGYSEYHRLTIYYFYLNRNRKDIVIITAFNE